MDIYIMITTVLWRILSLLSLINKNYNPFIKHKRQLADAAIGKGPLGDRTGFLSGVIWLICLIFILYVITAYIAKKWRYKLTHTQNLQRIIKRVTSSTETQDIRKESIDFLHKLHRIQSLLTRIPQKSDSILESSLLFSLIPWKSPKWTTRSKLDSSGDAVAMDGIFDEEHLRELEDALSEALEVLKSGKISTYCCDDQNREIEGGNTQVSDQEVMLENTGEQGFGTTHPRKTSSSAPTMTENLDISKERQKVEEINVKEDTASKYSNAMSFDSTREVQKQPSIEGSKMWSEGRKLILQIDFNKSVKLA